MNSTADGPGFEVVARQDFSDVTFLLEIRHPMLAKAARPGQFVIVMSHEQGERIPSPSPISTAARARSRS